jgi:hypothetical protein
MLLNLLQNKQNPHGFQYGFSGVVFSLFAGKIGKLKNEFSNILVCLNW